MEGRRYFSIIQTGPQPNPKPIIDNATDINGGLIFSLSQNTLGSQSQFWFGDGTQKGTHLFHTTDTPPFFTAAGGQAFFGDLERTDGTAKGTKLVKQLESEISDPVFAGGLLYFLLPTAAGANSPFALWRSDGTAAGTIPLGITLTAGGTGFDLRGPPVLQAVGNKLYFLDNRRSGTHFLGVSDGTVAGTHFIKNLPQNSYASFQQPNYQILSSGNEAIVFANTQGFNGAVPSVAIWRSDGKAADTQLVFKSSFTGGGNFFNDVAVAGPDLYIDVNGGMVRINPMKGPATTIVPFAFLPSYPASVAIGDTLYFVHPSPTTGSDTAALFAIDSTSTSPRLVKDYAQAGSQNVVPAGSQNTITGLFNSGGQLYVSHRQTLTNNDEIDTYTAMNPNGTGKDVMAIDESAPPNGIPGFISAPMPLVLPEKQELVVFSSGIHLLAPTGQIDYWNPATPKGKLALTNHIAGGQSDIQFKLVFVDSFMSGLTIKPLKLIGPNGDVLEAKLLNVSGAGTSSSPKVARFHVIGPGGSWGANDVGKYRVIVPKDAITTDTGAFAPGTVGTLSLVQADGETTSIQGIVYQDDNADGVQDNGEKGFVGATVFLDTNGDGELDGEESFTQSYDDKFSFVDHVDLAGGDYRVAVVPEPGMIFTTPDSFLLSCEPGTV
ncbi:MAG TPA: SdrD B-like domain-containing protein, partial [Tepidisphaeraceae bacterium]|nr:SdrD B-like domain-containing protein [Tepidisphaeraceae bacterium]